MLHQTPGLIWYTFDMNNQELVAHACTQVLRFTSVATWDDLSSDRQVQLGFNLGLVVLGLGLSKTEGYDALALAQTGAQSMQQLHNHFKSLISKHNIEPDQVQLDKPV
jgi:hypothetical protein